MGIYHRQTINDLLALEPLLVSNPAFPKNYLPPGLLNPTYVPPYQGNNLVIVVIITMVMVYPIVGLRLWVRWKSVGISTDDWLVFAATVCPRSFIFYLLLWHFFLKGVHHLHLILTFGMILQIGLTICSIICLVGVTIIGIGYHTYDLTFYRIDMSYMVRLLFPPFCFR